jgi:hypothetical protein
MPDSAATGGRPIFVVGCARSGTTLLQVMLHSHPRIAVPPENRFVMDVYRNRREFGDLRTKKGRAALASHIVDHPKRSRFKDFGLGKEAVRKRIVAGPPTVGSGVSAVLRAYSERFDKYRFGDKRPKYYQDVDALRTLFPNAQFIHLIRDGRDCVASLKRMTWWKWGVPAAVAMWGEAMDYGDRHKSRLPADTWHELYYEKMVVDPEGEMRRLCAFLGEDFAPAMVDQRETAEVAVPERKDHHVRIKQEVNADRVGAGRFELDPDELALFEWANGGRLRARSYDVPDKPTEPPADMLRAYKRLAAKRRWEHRKTHAEDRIRDLVSRRPVADQLG